MTKPTDPGVLSDLLSLVGVSASSARVLSWDSQQRQRAAEWASAVHLSASDNDVEVPPRPSFLLEDDPMMSGGDELDAEALANRAPRVVVEASWCGRIHKTEKVISTDDPAQAHHVVDKAVWDAHVQVRRALAAQRYGDSVLENTRLTQAGFRNETEAMAEIRNHCARTGYRFELVPPASGVTNMWRAYFKKPRVPSDLPYEPFAIEHNPAVGVGSEYYVAIENLLRFVEGREPVDG
jgi:hypothetical protein